MTYDELLAEVYTITNRPDLSAEAAVGVKSATLKLHRCDYFDKDLFETGISFTTSDYIQALDYRTLIPLWRDIKYLRKYDAVGETAGDELEQIPIEKVLDDYSLERVDVFYQAGAVYQIKSSTQEQYFLLGCYVNPSIVPATYDSWIATEQPYAIVFDAAAHVFKAIKQDETANTYSAMAREERLILVQNNVGIGNKS